jgi:hypothetical protein
MFRSGLVLLIGGVIASGCSSDRAPSVTAPTAVVPSAPIAPPTGATYTLFGVISESGPNGRVPIEGVIVEELTCDAVRPGCSVNRTVATRTDANGYYSLPGLYVGSDNFLWLTKPGFRIDVQLSPGCDFCYRSVTIAGDTRLDIELAREAPPE